MKHAGQNALDRLEQFLRQLCAKTELKEKSRGAFYRGSRAFLHFREDGDALFGDIRLTDDFTRVPATTKTQQAALMKKLHRALSRQKFSS